MSTFLVQCSCGKQLQVQSANSGKTARCPSCKGKFIIPKPPKTVGKTDGLFPANDDDSVEIDLPSLDEIVPGRRAASVSPNPSSPAATLTRQDRSAGKGGMVNRPPKAVVSTNHTPPPFAAYKPRRQGMSEGDRKALAVTLLSLGGLLGVVLVGWGVLQVAPNLISQFLPPPTVPMKKLSPATEEQAASFATLLIEELESKKSDNPLAEHIDIDGFLARLFSRTGLTEAAYQVARSEVELKLSKVAQRWGTSSDFLVVKNGENRNGDRFLLVRSIGGNGYVRYLRWIVGVDSAGVAKLVDLDFNLEDGLLSHAIRAELAQRETTRYAALATLPERRNLETYDETLVRLLDPHFASKPFLEAYELLPDSLQRSSHLFQRQLCAILEERPDSFVSNYSQQKSIDSDNYSLSEICLMSLVKKEDFARATNELTSIQRELGKDEYLDYLTALLSLAQAKPQKALELLSAIQGTDSWKATIDPLIAYAKDPSKKPSGEFALVGRKFETFDLGSASKSYAEQMMSRTQAYGDSQPGDNELIPTTRPSSYGEGYGNDSDTKIPTTRPGSYGEGYGNSSTSGPSFTPPSAYGQGYGR